MNQVHQVLLKKQLCMFCQCDEDAVLFIFQVSTYALFVDDVVEVFGDTVVVSDAAVSRIQRLTKVL